MTLENRKILIVDDDPVTRKVISFSLRKNNYQVFESEGSQKAFDILKSENISLVFCDISMNDLNGFDFCKQVREIDEYRALPFIFITAKNSAEDRQKAMDLGADDFITKPFNVEDLLMKANSVLKRVEIYKVYGLKKKFDESLSDQPPKVLLVDDDPAMAKLFSYSLKNEGFDVKVENSAMDGYNTAKTYLPDLILSDYMMPEIDGFGFRKMLLDDPMLADIPFVFLTANDSDNSIIEGYNLDIKDYILKTTSPKVVALKVGNIIKSLKRERRNALKELQEAADTISMEVVPASAPNFPGFKIFQWNVPYQGVPGGDFIDYINIDDNRMVVILGDIMGKKWGAWFFAFSFIGYIRSAIRVVIKNSTEVKASEILKKVNETIYNDAKISEIFSTVSTAIIDNSKNEIQYSGAGDHPMLRYDSVNKKVTQFVSDGLLLGLSNDGDYNDVIIELNKGDILFMYTDGLIESRNKEGEQFGVPRIKETILNSVTPNPEEELIKIFTDFTGNKYEDDVSMIAIKKL